MAQLAQRLLLNLVDALTRDAELAAKGDTRPLIESLPGFPTNNYRFEIPLPGGEA